MRANFVMSGVAQGMRRNLLMTIALVLTTAVSLSFVAGAILGGIEIHRFQHLYEGKLNASIYLCPGKSGQVVSDNVITANACSTAVTAEQEAALEGQLKADPRVASVAFVSVQEAYQIGLRTLPPAETQFLQPGDLPSSLTVKLKDINRDFPAVFAQYSKAAGVISMQNEDESLKTILRLLNGALLAAIVAAVVVLVCAVILIAITIQVAANQRRNETNIMRLVGASRWMTQLPFMIEGVIGAAAGGILALGATWIAKIYLLNGIFGTQVARGVLPNLSANDLLIAGGLALIAGVLLAAGAAYSTLRLYVRL